MIALAVLIDGYGGWIVAKYVRNIFLSILCAIAVGATAALTGTFFLYLVGSDLFSEREIAAKAIVGLFWHPLITIVVTLIARRTHRKKNAKNLDETSLTNKDMSRAAATYPIVERARSGCFSL